MMRRPFVLVLLLSLVYASGLSHAQDKTDDDAKQEAKTTAEKALPEYGGVVIDQTLTGLGRFFYVNFSQSWSEKENIESFVVAIKERPSQRGGTEVSVYSDDVVVFRSPLPRSYSAVDDLIYTAVDTVYTKLNQMRIDAALFNSGDLAKSGI